MTYTSSASSSCQQFYGNQLLSESIMWLQENGLSGLKCDMSQSQFEGTVEEKMRTGGSSGFYAGCFKLCICLKQIQVPLWFCLLV